MAGSLTITGDTELAAALTELGEKGSKKIMRKALRAGGKLVKNQMVADAPMKSGKTKEAIRTRARTRGNTVALNVEIDPAAARKSGAYYAPFVDSGHFTGKRVRLSKNDRDNKTNYATKSVAAGRRFVPGSHWVEKVKEKTAGPAEQAVAASIEQQVQEAFDT